MVSGVAGGVWVEPLTGPPITVVGAKAIGIIACDVLDNAGAVIQDWCFVCIDHVHHIGAVDDLWQYGSRCAVDADICIANGL